jgi:preprotein translocase subunit SecF
VDTLKLIYVRDYKRLFFVPLVLFILSSAILINSYIQTGDFIKRDVTLKGGISLSINKEIYDTAEFESFLNKRFPGSSINFRTIGSADSVQGIIIEASDISESELLEEVQERISLEKEDYSVETMGSSLGESFFRQMFVAVFFAFIAMGLVFQFYFRNWYATFAALFSAFLDIFITVGIIDLIGIRVTAGGIAAYLMLIGYSIDTSILLSTKMLRDKSDDLKKALFGAMKTGFTMSAAGIAATGISFLLTNNTTLKQIMLILIVGLVIDLITTWIGNVTFLRLYLEKKDGKT